MGTFAAAIPYVLAGVTAVAGVYSAKQSYDAGKLQKAQYKQAAAQEGDAARQREIERRQGLLRALASQNASAGAAGVSFEGSLQKIAQRDVEQAASDLQIERTGAGMRGRALTLAGREAEKAGTARAVTSLLDTADTSYRTWPGKPATAKKGLT